MKKFITKILKFSLFSSIIFLFVIVLLGINNIRIKGMNFTSNSPGRIKYRIEDLKKCDSLNILFLGSSHTFMGFDPRIFKNEGFMTFNFGSMAQTPIQTKYLYHKYAESIKTSLIIFEVNPQVISSDGIESTIDLLNSEMIDFSLIKKGLETKNIKVHNTLLFRLIQDAFGYKVKSPELGSYIIGSGYAPSFSTNEKSNEKIQEKTFHINNKQVVALKDLTDFWKENKVLYMLVQAPITRKFHNSILNNIEIDSIFNSLGNYKNYNYFIELDDSLDFVDFHHLNQNGVYKFNNLVLEDLKSILE